MIIKLDPFDDNRPVFLNLTQNQEEFEQAVTFSLMTGYEDMSEVAHAIATLENMQDKYEALLKITDAFEEEE
jgi:hypothetical protein